MTIFPDRGIFVLLERPGGPKRCRAGSQEVSGAQGKPRAPERRPESFEGCLDDDFPIEAFLCQVWFPANPIPGHPKEEGLLDY